MPENGNLDAADNNNDQDDLCIEVSDDDEEQKEFLNVFQKVGQTLLINQNQSYAHMKFIQCILCKNE